LAVTNTLAYSGPLSVILKKKSFVRFWHQMDLHSPEEKVFLETISVPDRGLKLRKNIKISLDMGFQSSHILLCTSTGRVKANGREPKSCLG